MTTGCDPAGPLDHEWLTDLIGVHRVPGAAYAVVADGEIVSSGAVGVTPDGAAMTRTTVLQVGSVSKVVTALGVMSMVERGDLDLDADVRDRLSSIRLAQSHGGPEQPVTLRQLLSHTAGAGVHGFLGYDSPADAPPLIDVLEGRGDSPEVAIETEPGSGFCYSGGGYELIHQLLVDVTGAAHLDDVIRPALFDAVPMLDSTFALSPPSGRPVSTGSIDGQPLEGGWRVHPESAAAGLWTTAIDLGTLLAAFCRPLLGRADSLFSAETASLMLRPVTDADEGEEMVGLGWFLRAPLGDRPGRFHHRGRNLGYAALLEGTIDGSWAIVLVTNGFPGGSQFANEVVTRAFGCVRGEMS